jgi:NAD(P)-dependent dehydrogenase (short-subunit alcohol dehydrogenase family)
MIFERTGVVVTGASRGLGAALARELARRGARVLCVARGPSALAETVEGIRKAGGDAHAFVADVGDKNATYAIAGAAAELVGPVELLIHDASSLGAVPLSSWLDTDCETLEEVLRVNVVGPFRLTKAIAGRMLVRGRGLVVHVTSDAATHAYPRWGAYGVSKAALDHMARIWAAELAGAGVRFLSIDPGEMNTTMHRDAVPDADPASLADPAVVAARVVALIARSHELASGARVDANGSPA